MKLNKYRLFAGEEDYPEGGYFDFVGSFDTIEEAKKVGEEFVLDKDIIDGWCHVVFKDKIIVNLSTDVYFNEELIWKQGDGRE